MKVCSDESLRHMVVELSRSTCQHSSNTPQATAAKQASGCIVANSHSLPTPDLLISMQPKHDADCLQHTLGVTSGMLLLHQIRIPSASSQAAPYLPSTHHQETSLRLQISNTTSFQISCEHPKNAAAETNVYAILLMWVNYLRKVVLDFARTTTLALKVRSGFI
eukprot:1138782-Pelagomonas_calceolata.AAC.4